ncbi:MAG: HalD/BesD family halogenase [bacterium]
MDGAMMRQRSRADESATTAAANESANESAQAASPSAYAAAEIQLEALIDLAAFPIHDLASPARAELVAHCRAEIDAVGCSHIPGFIRADAVRAMRVEAHRLMPRARPADDRINPYLTADDPSLPADHPKRIFAARTSSFINSDLLEPDSLLRKIYDSDVMVHFVGECLGVAPIYRWADPLGRNPYGVMRDGDNFPWHFDGNDFTVSILVQQSDHGGDFEYCPDIRSARAENFDRVRQVLHGAREPVRVLTLRTGDLQLFRGRYSLHRVTPPRGPNPRIIALPTYVTNPYLVNRPHHAKAFYGRAMKIHIEREMARSDSLAD